MSYSIAMKHALLATLTFGLIGMSLAAPQIDTRGLVVNPIPVTPTGLQTWVWNDRDPSGNGTPVYRPGDTMKLYVKANKDSYIYLFSVDANGKVDLILPNGYSGGGNYVKANQIKQFPAPGARFNFSVDNVLGVNKVLAVASTTKLNIAQLATVRSGGFADMTSEGASVDSFTRGLVVTLTPVPAKNWVSDTALYYVK